jgi:hypothetical protein
MLAMISAPKRSAHQLANGSGSVLSKVMEAMLTVMFASCHRRDRAPGAGVCSSGPLPDDLGGGLVVAQPEKARLPQPTVTRPLGEADLGDQLGAGPVRAARDRSRIESQRSPQRPS